MSFLSRQRGSLYFDETKLIPYLKNGKYGFCDRDKKIIIETKYDAAYPFADERALVMRNKKFGFIDKTGNEVIPLKYDSAKMFSEDLAAVGANGKWGFINKLGNEVIPLKYGDADSFSEGLVVVKDPEFSLYLFIDKTGEYVKGTFASATKFSEEYAVVTEDWMAKSSTPLHYIDNKKSNIINDRTSPDSILFKYPTKSGDISKDSNITSLGLFSQGLATFALQSQSGNNSFTTKYGYIDKDGKEVISPKYEMAYEFGENLAPVKVGGKFGYIDKTDKMVITPKYDVAGKFTEGLAVVAIKGKYGYIDQSGKEIISVKYDNAIFFFNGLGIVKLGNNQIFIDKNGTEYYEP